MAPWDPDAKLQAVNGFHRYEKRDVTFQRVIVINLDGSNYITAQYNPKEYGIDKSAEWTETANSKGNGPELGFGSTKARTVSLELFFDTYELGVDVHAKYVKHLIALMDVINVDGKEDQKRPPRIQLEWGGKFPSFIGVVASVSTKYTMFLPDGTAVRATCACKFTEATRIKAK